MRSGFALFLAFAVGTPVQAKGVVDYISQCNPHKRDFVDCYEKAINAFYASLPKEPVRVPPRDPNEAAYNMAIFNAQQRAETQAELDSRPDMAVEPFNPGIEYYRARYGSRKP